jgi:hypothetical protein
LATIILARFHEGTRSLVEIHVQLHCT